MKWLNNLESIATEKRAGKCPYCGNENTDFSIKKAHRDSDIGYGDIWCNSCKRAFHISRIMVTDATLKDIPTPMNLIY